MTQTNNVVVVTRYTDYDSELTFLGVFNDGKKAHQEVAKNIELYGKYSYRKQVGDWDYTLKVKPNSVEMLNPEGEISVKYSLTEVTPNKLVHITDF